MISALTDPKKIASPLRREGIWIYAGRDLNRFHAFRKGLSEKLSTECAEKYMNYEETDI